MTTKKWANQFGKGDMDGKPTSVWGKKLLGGTAGMTLTAKQTVDLMFKLCKKIPYDTYCEPFAGKARVYDILSMRKDMFSYDQTVLNDMSTHSNEFCKEHFKWAIGEHISFEETIKKYDNDNAFFLIDPPWRRKIYTNNEFFTCTMSIPDYYNKLLEMVETMKGDWFITSSADEHECRGVLTKSKWNTLIIKSNEKRKVFGKPARTLICSNLIPDEMNGEEIQ